jgi:hypothetical protein
MTESADRLLAFADRLADGYDPTPAFMYAYGPAPTLNWIELVAVLEADLRAAAASGAVA